MAKISGGFVYGIDHIKELTSMSLKNIKKSHKDLLNDGKIVMTTGDGRDGLKEYAPYDVIHVGAAVERLPRHLME